MPTRAARSGRSRESSRVAVVVIGAGQAGLSAAYHLRRAGLAPHTDFVVLDDAPGPGGAWQHGWPSLTMAQAQAHGVHELPGMPIPDRSPDARASAAVPEYFGGYESTFDLPVVRPVRVRAVQDAGDGSNLLTVETDGGTWRTSAVVNATGTWQKPFWPWYPGRATFDGRQLHSHDFRDAHEFLGEHVVVVGGGTSAVQQLLEIARVTTTTWVTRRPPVFVEPAPDEEDEGAAVAQVDEEPTRAGLPPQSAVSVTGLPLSEETRRGLQDGVLRRLPMFERLVTDGVVWAAADAPPAPEHVRADVVLWATGFRPALDHLAPLRLRAPGGGIVMDGPEVLADPRIQLVGYGPGASSASRAGRTAVRNLRRQLGF